MQSIRRKFRSTCRLVKQGRKDRQSVNEVEEVIMKYRIPDQIPTFIEIDEDVYIPTNLATVRHWHDAIEFADTRDKRARRAIYRMVDLAEAIGVPDEVLLWPLLESVMDKISTILRAETAKPCHKW